MLGEKMTSALNKAVRVATFAHQGQTDQAGLPYITHPLRVMQSLHLFEEDVQAGAVLHDVLEDSKVTAEDLLTEGIPSTVVDAVVILTRVERETYDDYVARCRDNWIARRVKMADPEDNMRSDRMLLRPEHLNSDLNRLRKYALSYQFLKGLFTEKEYREAMSPFDP